MNNLTINKNNFGQILDKFYFIINNDNKSIVLNYVLLEDNENLGIKKVLQKLQKDPITSNINPITFQQNARNEWK